MRAFIMNILKWLDAGLNVWAGGLLTLFVKHNVPALGNFHYSCSEAWAEMVMLKDKGEPLWMYQQGCFMCAILTKIQNLIFRIPGSHCLRSMEGMPIDIESA